MTTPAPPRFLLQHNRAPGDIVVMTAFVRDLKLAFPDVTIGVKTSAMDLWRHNPHVTSLRGQKGAQTLTLDYGRGIREQKYETIHFLSYFHRDFHRRTKMTVPLVRPYPDLHLSPEEQTKRPVQDRYWVVVAGGKSDFTAKVWHTEKFQATVDELRRQGIACVQVGGNDRGHWHPPLRGALNLVGRTNLRDMLRLIHHADGVLCGVSLPMHVAAALQRPCVVLGGGREAWWWEAYVRENVGLGGKEVAEQLKMPHRFLHTLGLLDCCKWAGCWKNKVVRMGKDPLICLRPVVRPGQAVPECLDMITVDMVMTAILSYYYDGSLAPIRGSALAQDVNGLHHEGAYVQEGLHG